MTISGHASLNSALSKILSLNCFSVLMGSRYNRNPNLISKMMLHKLNCEKRGHTPSQRPPTWLGKNLATPFEMGH